MSIKSIGVVLGRRALLMKVGKWVVLMSSSIVACHRAREHHLEVGRESTRNAFVIELSTWKGMRHATSLSSPPLWNDGQLEPGLCYAVSLIMIMFISDLITSWQETRSCCIYGSSDDITFIKLASCGGTVSNFTLFTGCWREWSQ